MTLDAQLTDLLAEPRRWLVTGVAGFIGSHLLEALLGAGQEVTGLDNFATGHRRNLEEVRDLVGPDAWARFRFLEGDVRDLAICREAAAGCAYILHEAALASVPLSIQEPIATHETNLGGFLNLLVAGRDLGVRRMVYASSSAVYGDGPGQPKREDLVGLPLSPYALTKHMNEQYAGLFGRVYGLETVGLRYFNVYGRRQDPEGPYAAVIPIWVAGLLRRRPCLIHGDGANTRDFCHVQDVVQANLRAALAAGPEAVGRAFNVAAGGSITLNELEAILRTTLARRDPGVAGLLPTHGPARAGDIVHSRADLGEARRCLGFEPSVSLEAGLEEAMAWYREHL